MPFFICPSCGNRLQSSERTTGFGGRPKGCSKCGFGFLFELLDDYYPAPDAAFFTCDQEGRVLDVGRGGFELTGLKDENVIGRPIREVLGLVWLDDEDAKVTAGSVKAEAGSDADADDAPSGSVEAPPAGDPIDMTLEWGVRSLDKPVEVTAEGDLPARATADLFPAYDDDGGLLVVLTPTGS